MFEVLKRLFDEGTLSEKGLKNAVEKKLITPDQFLAISGKSYDGI